MAGWISVLAITMGLRGSSLGCTEWRVKERNLETYRQTKRKQQQRKLDGRQQRKGQKIKLHSRW
jgi:hypothetical protein